MARLISSRVRESSSGARQAAAQPAQRPAMRRPWSARHASARSGSVRPGVAGRSIAPRCRRQRRARRSFRVRRAVGAWRPPPHRRPRRQCRARPRPAAQPWLGGLAGRSDEDADTRSASRGTQCGSGHGTNLLSGRTGACRPRQAQGPARVRQSPGIDGGDAAGARTRLQTPDRSARPARESALGRQRYDRAARAKCQRFKVVCTVASGQARGRRSRLRECRRWSIAERRETPG